MPDQERIAFMDVLRGIAVFGIFLINMPLYVAPSDAFFHWENNVYWTGSADRLTNAFLYVFAQGKFYTLFSFLFGLGFGVQLLRAAERQSVDFPSVYRRRLSILLLIGVLHLTLVWWGDVLHIYAALGFLLLTFRDRPDRTLVFWIAYLLVIPFVLAVSGTTIQHLSDKTPEAEKQKERKAERQEVADRIAKNVSIKSTGTFLEILEARLGRDLLRIGGSIGWYGELFASFLIGLWVSRRRIVQEPQHYQPLLKRLAFVALPAGLLVAVADVAYGYQHPDPPSPLWREYLSFSREFLARPAMAFGYAALLLLAGVRNWMSPFAAAGRMALSNYLLHSLVFTTVANSYGLGLYGKIPPLQGVGLCAGFFAIQLPFSVWWLRHHYYGPAEWLWRSLTYGERQPWRKPPAGHALS